MWILLAAVVLVVVLGFVGKGTYHQYRLASTAVERFHQQLDAGDYEGICGEASDDFRTSGNHADLISFLDKIHQKMGDSATTSLAGFHVHWTNGRLWVDEVSNTQFSLGQGQESFVWIVEQDQLHLYRYHITSPNLR